MKKHLFNLNQLVMSWNEKQKPRRIGQYAAMLIMLLTLGVGQMWADDKGFYEVYMVYDKNGTEYNYTYNGSNGSMDLGTITSSFKIKQMYLKVWDNWSDQAFEAGSSGLGYKTQSGSDTDYKANIRTSKSGSNYELQHTNMNLTIASNTNPSGNYTFTHWWFADGTWTDTYYLKNGSSNCAFTYKILPPAVKSGTVAVSATNTAPGSGTGLSSGSPIILVSGMASTLTITATQNHTDANSALWCKFGTGSYSSTTTYNIASGTTTSNQTIALAVKYRNDDASLDGTETTTTIYYKWAAPAPAIVLTSVTPSTSIVAGNDITLVGTRANSSNAISFQYTTNDGSTWTDISPKTSSTVENATTATWTVPDAHGATQTFKFRAKLAEATPIYSSKSDGVTVYNTKTIHVRDINDWANFYSYVYNHNGSSTTGQREAWPGSKTEGISILAGQWKNVVLTSQYTYFILNNGSSSSQLKGETYTYSDVSDDGYYTISQGPGSSLTLTGTTAPAAPTATTNDANEITSTTAKFNYSVNANRDKTTPGIAFKQSDDDIDAATIYSSGTKVAGSATNGNASGSTAAQTITPGKKYYYVAYGTNGFGTSYGTVKSFVAPYKVTITQPTGCSAITPGTGTQYVHIGDEISSTAATGYTFSSWSVTNVTLSSPTTTTGVTRSTITAISADNGTIQPVYTENMTTVNLVASPTGKGTFTSGGTVTSVSAGIDTHPTVTAVPGTGYHLTGTIWSESSDYISLSATNTASTTISATGATGKSADLTATFTPNTYTIHFNGNGNTSGSMSDQTGVTYDAATTITANAFAKTGYNFAGWATTQERANAGTVDRADGAAHGNLTSTQGATAQLWAVWTAKTSALTLDQQSSAEGYGSAGTATASASATYGAAMPALTGTMPSAKNGYAFMGFYDAADGEGTQYYTSTGASARTWDKNTESPTTLYAYYKKAEITNIAFGAGAVVENGSTVTVTATISPTPTGTTTVCWRILYDNDSPLYPQPAFDPVTAQGNSVSFTAPAASGMYKVEAVLHTGSGCAGTDLSTLTANFQVAGSHTVTVQYHDGSSNSIKASTSVTGRPLVWSDPITAPDVFGYLFEYWQAGDGITLSKDGSSTHDKDTAKVATVYIKATYNGTLTAVYKPADILYFKNTMGWSNVYVYFYTSDKYWDQTYYGSGTYKEKQFCEKKKNDKGEEYDDCTKPYWDQKHGQLTRLGETDIWYIDFGALGCADWHHLVFNANQQDNYEWFSATELVRRGDLSKGTPMFVPADKSTYNPTTKNSNAKYYNQGYWTKYIGDKTGYTLEIYNSAGNSLLKEIPLTGDENLMPMTAKADLEGGTNYKFQIRRDNSIYYGNSGTMTYANHGQGTPWAFTNGSPFPGMCTITTTAAGDYKFTLTYSKDGSGNYELRMAVDYPISDGDYRLVYSDAVQTKPLTSAVVPHMANKDTIVSFFIRKAQSPNLRLQKATVAGGGAITWNEYPTSGTPTNQLTSEVLGTLPQDSVYNINLHMDGSSNLSVSSVTPYEGEFYIRTDGVRNKWDNFRAADHLMTYSEYAEKNSGFTHYFMSHVYGGTSVKFVVANDYAPNISDTLVQQAGDAGHVTSSGNLWTNEGAEANIRFMWNRHDNSVSRAYLAAAKSDGSKFLVLRANASTDLMDEDGNALINSANSGQAGYNHKAPDNSMQFTDDENWIYETTVKVKPSAFVKLYAHYHGEDFYFKGKNNNTFDEDNAIQILGGTGDAEKLHVVYDFKTGRLVSAWMPSGNIEDNRQIYADVMFLREHQGDIEQLTFGEDGKISEINTAYAVMRFSKWTLNNKSKEVGHSPLSPELSRYERDLFYVSFPFRVNLEEVFGFGTYGKHWIIQEYDGAGRAEKGYWADSPSFWKFVTNRKGKFLEPNTGYILALDLDELGESSSVWDNGVEKVELYFPSYGAMPNITSSSVTYEVPAHTCTIGPRFEGGDDRRVKDSHWNVLSVPTYVNTNSVSFANNTWTTAGDGQLGPNFLYTVNWNDNSLSARSGVGYTYHAMHAYIVQYCGNVTWTTSVSPATAPRRNPEAPKDAEYRLELRQNEQTIDQTFVRLSNDEHVTTGFEFNYDLSKEFNKNKANIYTMVTTQMADGPSITETAGNTLPMSEQTTIIPVGVKIATDGEYTFAISDGTSGVGVTLIDNVLNTRTNLGLTDYTVNLNAGTIDGRFILEISPVQGTITSLEPISDEGLEISGARKVIIDQKMYIIRGNEIFDARGAKVK